MMRSRESGTMPPTTAHDSLAESHERLLSAVEDRCYTIAQLHELSGWSKGYLRLLVRLPDSHPDHLPSIGPKHARRVPVLVWRAYLARTGSADTAATLVAQSSSGHSTRVGTDRQGVSVPSGHKGRRARAWPTKSVPRE
jgi:hypothetical protein